ncbi:proton-conducting transporter membrane subunit [Micromonospora aurantiaca]|nr:MULTISPECIES: proton-conducting transporter membrane subunit [Micromonospora]MBC8990228.1 NADH-quinone oxidoreductase subunit N [Micromonospora chalcea]MBC9003214.1 NADH-quinone oxidoreductase subunit N [Micromonospora aurantiaca]MCT2281812.1 NADH-quinone oxidoreductase subunit N [Micromonospora chalcea]MDG4752777.1 proton-conducting transporter membrane subunit [Micromonospora sp. WMMD718]UFN92579.1 NADH-quinone oxidoreductase subunit N [Micromonospora aurantiaca]
METEMMRPLLLVPEMLLAGGALAALIGGSFVPRHRQWIIRIFTAVVLVATIVVAAIQLGEPATSAFDNSFAVDTATGIARILAASGTLLILAIAADEISGTARESETYSLLLFSTAGAVLLAGANDLLALAVGFLLASIPLYALIGLAHTAAGAEAALKTYLLGALFGILLLLGVTVLTGLSGTTTYPELSQRLPDMPRGAVAVAAVALLAGLMFKAGGVPAHFWVPDAAQGTSATAATFLTTVPKIGALIAVFRLAGVLPTSVSWAVAVAVVAAVSMTLGNLAAYWQSDPRRLLGWSTVSQVGFLLVPIVAIGRSDLALPSLLLYLAGYTVTNIAAFAVTAALPEHRDLTDFRGLAYRRPGLAAALLVALLGLVGTPPTAVFVGKLTTATAAWDGEYAWLAVVVFVNSVLSLFYYLRWIVPVYREPGDSAVTSEAVLRRVTARTAILASAVSLALGLVAGPLWYVVSR